MKAKLLAAVGATLIATASAASAGATRHAAVANQTGAIPTNTAKQSLPTLAYQIVNGSSGRCLDVRWNANYNGNQVWLWDCNGTLAQAWYVTIWGQLRNAGTDKCLDVPTQNLYGWGQTLQIWNCGIFREQMFSMWTHDYPIRSKASGLCLDDYAFQNFNGARVVQWGCNGGSNQNWTFGYRPFF